MADLITASYARTQLGRLSTADSARVPDLVKAASEVVRNHCRCRLTAENYQEVIRAGFDGSVALAQRPLIRIDRIAGNPKTAITISNSTAQRSSVRVRTTGEADVPGSLVPDALVLTRHNSGVKTENTLLLADSLTFTALATAITALGSGWSATADIAFANWPTADLYSPQETFDARSVGPNYGCKLSIFTDDARYGEVNLENATARVWDNLSNFEWLQVSYRAGFETVPSVIQQAAATIVGALLKAGEAAVSGGANLRSRALADRRIEFYQGNSVWPGGAASAIEAALATIPSRYRRHRFVPL